MSQPPPATGDDDDGAGDLGLSLLPDSPAHSHLFQAASPPRSPPSRFLSFPMPFQAANKASQPSATTAHPSAPTTSTTSSSPKPTGAMRVPKRKTSLKEASLRRLGLSSSSSSAAVVPPQVPTPSPAQPSSTSKRQELAPPRVSDGMETKGRDERQQESETRKVEEREEKHSPFSALHLRPVSVRTDEALVRMQRWCLAFGCVNFDLELGPDLEFLYPPIELSRKERDNIAFSSFPDTSIFAEGACVFSFRIRELPSEPPALLHPTHSRSSSHSHSTSRSAAITDASFPRSATRSPPHGQLVLQNPSASASAVSLVPVSRRAPPPAAEPTVSSYLYGYVFFRQRKDSTIKRGYFQKSVIIISHLPYVSLLSEVISRLGPLYFEHGLPMLEAASHDVASWPDPLPGSSLELPFLGTVFDVELPSGHQVQKDPPLVASVVAKSKAADKAVDVQNGLSAFGAHVEPRAPLLASLPPTSLFATFADLLPDFWLLWESVLLAEPVLVVAPDPKTASDAVWWLRDVIRPIPHAGDFRPYFHIHDNDYRTLVNKNKPPAGAMIGTTNPHFVHACSHWPHVLRVGKPPERPRPRPVGSSSSAPALARRPSGQSSSALFDHTPGLTSKRKRRVSKDRPLIRRLTELAKTDGAENVAMANALMRGYFADLTEKFLAPLNRYFASLIPADFSLTSPRESPKIRPFDGAAFLLSLKTHGTPIPLRSRHISTSSATSLYIDFIRCPNFAMWLHERVERAQEEQRRRRVNALCTGDVERFGRTMSEVEVVDLISRIRDEIKLVEDELRDDGDRSASVVLPDSTSPSTSSFSTLVSPRRSPAGAARDGQSSSFLSDRPWRTVGPSASASASAAHTPSASTSTSRRSRLLPFPRDGRGTGSASAGAPRLVGMSAGAGAGAGSASSEASPAPSSSHGGGDSPSSPDVSPPASPAHDWLDGESAEVLRNEDGRGDEGGEEEDEDEDEEGSGLRLLHVYSQLDQEDPAERASVGGPGRSSSRASSARKMTASGGVQGAETEVEERRRRAAREAQRERLSEQARRLIATLPEHLRKPAEGILEAR